MPLDFGQQTLPIQPVERPILCSPYVEPHEHWVYNTDNGAATRQPGRRPASYWFKTVRTNKKTTLTLPGMAEEEREDLPSVNALREDVRRWRASGYEGATNITKELLRHWTNPDRPRRLFFCQVEAVETMIFLNEIRGLNRDGTRRKPRFNPQFTDDQFGELVDKPNEPGFSPLTRYGCKMATGSGKTVVMSMLIAWAFCNRGQVASDDRFPAPPSSAAPTSPSKSGCKSCGPRNPATTMPPLTSFRPACAPSSARAKCWSPTGMPSPPRASTARAARPMPWSTRAKKAPMPSPGASSATSTTARP